MPNSGTQTRGEGGRGPAGPPLSTARRRLDAALEDSPLRIEVLGTPADKGTHCLPRRQILSWSPESEKGENRHEGGNGDVTITRKFDYLRARRATAGHSPQQLIESSEEAARRLDEELHQTRVALAESLRDAAVMERQRDADREQARAREIEIENEREEARRCQEEMMHDLEARARELERQRAKDAASSYKHSVIVALLAERRLHRKRLEALWSTQATASCARFALASWQQHRHAQQGKREERFRRCLAANLGARRRRAMRACVRELWAHTDDARIRRGKATRQQTLAADIEKRARGLLQACVALWCALTQRAVRGRLQLALTDSLDIAESLSAQKRDLAARAIALQKMCGGCLRRGHAQR